MYRIVKNKNLIVIQYIIYRSNILEWYILKTANKKVIVCIIIMQNYLL